MRCAAFVLALASTLLGSATLAGELPRPREVELGYGKAKAPPVERANPCAAHGPGFHAAPGSSSCVRVFGRVRMDVESRRTTR